MTVQYTPGPWKLKPVDDRFLYGTRVQGPERDDAFNCIADVPGGKDPECLANARLIAAAPDLLEALKSLLIEGPKSVRDLGNLVDPITYTVALNNARAAIAKAEGDNHE